jgi:hypothetical protein
MDFLKYKKLLESKNIILFDHELRISHFEINSLNTIIKGYKEQIGGGKRNSILDKLKKLNDDNLLNIVKLSLSSNSQMIINFI